MVVDKAWHYRHVVVLLLLRCVADGSVDIKVPTDDVDVGPLLLPHVEFLPVDEADVLLDDGRVV